MSLNSTVKLLNLLLLEHEILILVFPVPQSVQKVKTAKFHKPYGIIEQKKRSFFTRLEDFYFEI